MEMQHEGEWISWGLFPMDSAGTQLSSVSRDQNIPLADGGFVPMFSYKNLAHRESPKTITVAAKTGTTTATLTIPNHGYVLNDWVIIYGIRDQTNFVNQTVAVQVASVVNSNQITVVFGIAVTASSYGGFVLRVSQNTQPFIASSAIQSVNVSNGRMLLTFLASQGTWLPGETICITGLVDSTNVNRTEYEGIWRVAKTDTTAFTMELEPLAGQAVPTGSITMGGSALPAPEMRVHFMRMMTHTRMSADISSGRSNARAANSLGVVVVNTPGVTVSGTAAVNVSQVAGVTASSAVEAVGTNRGLGVISLAGTTNADKASSALTTSGNSGTIADNMGNAICGLINVSGTSGTTPTMDITLEESYDNGTTWQTVWTAPRITANGTYPIPPMLVLGRRRWVYAIGGATPSFTTIITTMRTNAAQGLVRQFVDRAITPNSLSTSATYYVEGCTKFSLIATSGAGATTSPVYGIQFSFDGTNWADSGISVTVPASSTLGASVAAPFPARYARIAIKTVGVAATHTQAVLAAAS
jgi:hypothetical protein